MSALCRHLNLASRRVATSSSSPTWARFRPGATCGCRSSSRRGPSRRQRQPPRLPQRCQRCRLAARRGGRSCPKCLRWAMGTGEGAVPSAFNPQRPGGSVESPHQGQEARVDVLRTRKSLGTTRYDYFLSPRLCARRAGVKRRVSRRRPRRRTPTSGTAGDSGRSPATSGRPPRHQAGPHRHRPRPSPASTAWAGAKQPG